MPAIFLMFIFCRVGYNVALNDPRHIVYPPGFGNKVQFIVGIGVPASNLPSVQSVTWGYVIKTNYVLPTNITEYGESQRYMKRSAGISRWDFYQLIVDVIDRPSSSKDTDTDYYRAELDGEYQGTNCARLYRRCPLSLVDLFSIVKQESYFSSLMGM